MRTVQLDKVKLKSIMNASKTATTSMILLGFKQRHQAYTNIATVKSQLKDMGEAVQEKEYMEFWKALQDAGVGEIILGRRGGHTRFEWFYSLRDVAQAAIEGKGDVKKLRSSRSRHRSSPSGLQHRRRQLATAPKREERLVFNIQVRPGYALEVNLPGDISPEELEKVKNSFSTQLRANKN